MVFLINRFLKTFISKRPNLFMKVIFLFYMLRSFKPWHSCCTFGIIGNLSMSKGEMSWSHNVSKYDTKDIEY